MAITRLVTSKNYKDFEEFSKALEKEYELSYRPSAVKILSYPDGTVAAVWGEQRVNENPSDQPKKHFFVSAGEDVEEQIALLNVAQNVTFDGMRVSKPFIDTNKYVTVVFVAAEELPEEEDDDYDDDYDSEEEE